MKILRPLFIITAIIVLSKCSSNDDIIVTPTSVSFNFTHAWGDLEVNADEFNILQYVTENEDSLLINQLRYIVSDFVFTHESGTVVELDEFLLIDVGTEQNLSLTTLDTILPGTYSVSFRFGLGEEDNQTTEQSLIAAGLQVDDTDPTRGYYFMQLGGQYLDADDDRQDFNFYATKAFDSSGENESQNTSFEVNLGTVVIGGNTTINVVMDVAEWFANPNTWDLNELNLMLEENFEAQVDIGQNGASVFTLNTEAQ